MPVPVASPLAVAVAAPSSRQPTTTLALPGRLEISITRPATSPVPTMRIRSGRARRTRMATHRATYQASGSTSQVISSGLNRFGSPSASMARTPDHAVTVEATSRWRMISTGCSRSHDVRRYAPTPLMARSATSARTIRATHPSSPDPNASVTLSTSRTTATSQAPSSAASAPVPTLARPVPDIPRPCPGPFRPPAGALRLRPVSPADTGSDASTCAGPPPLPSP